MIRSETLDQTVAVCQSLILSKADELSKADLRVRQLREFSAQLASMADVLAVAEEQHKADLDADGDFVWQDNIGARDRGRVVPLDWNSAVDLDQMEDDESTVNGIR